MFNVQKLTLILCFCRLQKSQDDDNEDDLEKDGEKIDRVREDRDGVRNGSVLNLSQQAHSDLQEGGGSSIRGSDSDIGEPEADIGSEEDMDMDKEDKAPNNMFQMMNQIQSLIKMTVEKAKQEEKNSPSQKSEYFVLYSYRYDGDDVCYQARNENLI